MLLHALYNRHTTLVVDKGGWVDDAHKAGILPVPDRVRKQALCGVTCSQVARSMTVPDNRSPLTSDCLKPRLTACPFYINLITEKRRSSYLYLAQENGILRYSFQPKNHYRSLPAAPTRIASPKSNARHVPKTRAGAEATFRTAWIEHPILS